MEKNKIDELQKKLDAIFEIITILTEDCPLLEPPAPPLHRSKTEIINCLKGVLRKFA